MSGKQDPERHPKQEPKRHLSTHLPFTQIPDAHLPETGTRLPRDFFTVSTVSLAQNLLGCVLMRHCSEGVRAGRIVETEAYTEDDPASHSFGGKRTKRNAMMFAEGGHLYVYLSYGIHTCMNVVSGSAGDGSAVLIRALQPVYGGALMRKARGRADDDTDERTLTNGPGKVCQALGITREHDGVDITNTRSPIYICSNGDTPAISATSRIGISRGQDRQWRFVVE